jgi:hypothetical protein
MTPRLERKGKQMARFGQEVRIAGGMKEFVGRLGTIVGEEGTRPRMYRVRLHEPVEVPGVGEVTDDLWQGNALKTVRRARNGKHEPATLVDYVAAAKGLCPARRTPDEIEADA